MFAPRWRRYTDLAPVRENLAAGLIALGVRQGTVMSRLHRGRDQLARGLQPG